MLKSKCMLLIAFLALAIPLIFMGNAMAETAACVTAECHGNAGLVKTVNVAGGGTETVPLYVDIDAYNTAAHGTAAEGGAVECTACHTDITTPGPHSVAKTFGGWARFSKNGGDVPAELRESIPANTNEWTRNYYSTAVAASCPACHTTQAPAVTSAHATIYKLRGAHIDQGLTDYAISQGDSGSLSNGFVGENYAAANCNRCHASCQSCHFKSTVSAKNADSVRNHWDEIQATDKYTPSPCGGEGQPACTPISVPDSMSEFQMIRTSNIASHEFRSKEYFETDADGVCEACHIGFNRPPKNAYYWLDEEHTIPGVVKAVRVKRHPQAAELEISGSMVLSPLTGGNNTTHAAMECADCHGTAFGGTGNVHNLPGVKYDWRTTGDVQCSDCHINAHDSSPFKVQVEKHINGSYASGKKVACVGCHTFGLARDLEIANTGSSTSHEVFLDPETNEVRPVVWKNAEAIAWYSHNWQTLNSGTGTTDPGSDCAKKCHYTGNVAGAGVGLAGADHGADIVASIAVKGADAVCGICHTAVLTNTATCLTSECHGNQGLEKTINVAGGTETVPLYVNEALYYNPDTPHSNKTCVVCHTDITTPGPHSVAKTFGGWARFSKNGGDVPAELRESIPANTNEWTRNYYSTAVAASCPACHTTQAPAVTSAHATIYKLRGAHIDQGLTDYAISQGDSGSLSNGFVGENYAAANCNRCHASCQSCHFKSTVSAKNADSVRNHWDEIQATDKYTPTCGSPPLPSCPTTPISVPDSMSEFQMIRTTNIASHEIRKGAYFETDSEGVCEACHIGFNRPPKNAYYWKDEAHTMPGVVKAVRVKRHPQAAELAISGSTVLSPLTGGNNTAHAAMECVDCHGTAFGGTGNVHSLPGTAPENEDPWATRGDVHCADCHGSYLHVNTAVAAHLDDTGTKVACTGCHTFGLARDFEIAKTGSSTSHEVFLDPETNEVRPVVWKNAEAIAWYSHNWQTLNAGVSPIDPAGDCAKKCHYTGNLVGANHNSNNCEACHGSKALAINMNSIACVNCHNQPGLIPTAGDCLTCHTDKDAAWATANSANMHPFTPPVAGFTTVVNADTWQVSVTDTSTDAEGLAAVNPIRVTWGDTFSSTGSEGGTFTHTYGAAGTYTITLTATDAGGLTDSETGSAVVSAFTISGNAAVDGATLTLKNSANRTIASTTSAVGGAYSFGNVKPGAYSVTVYKTGTTFNAPNPVTGISVGPSAANVNFATVQTKFKITAVTTGVEDAKITVKNSYGTIVSQGYTNDSGEYSTAQNLTAGTYNVTAYKRRYTFDGDPFTDDSQKTVAVTVNSTLGNQTVTFTH